VAQSPDGRLVVAALRDGTVRWYRASDGVELLAVFLPADGKRWVAFSPSGYYAAGPGAEDLVGWQVDNGPDQAASFYPASRFRDYFYRPDVVSLVLKTLDEPAAVQQAEAAAAPPEAPKPEAPAQPEAQTAPAKPQAPEPKAAEQTLSVEGQAQKPEAEQTPSAEAQAQKPEVEQMPPAEAEALEPKTAEQAAPAAAQAQKPEAEQMPPAEAEAPEPKTVEQTAPVEAQAPKPEVAEQAAPAESQAQKPEATERAAPAESQPPKPQAPEQVATARQEASSPVPAATELELPALAPVRVVLSVSRDDAGHHRSAADIRQALAAAGLEVADHVPVDAQRSGPSIRYYFQSDRSAAAEVSHLLEPLLGAVAPVAIRKRTSTPEPGTIEIAIP
jgi:hypothetical protein